MAINPESTKEQSMSLDTPLDIVPVANGQSPVYRKNRKKAIGLLILVAFILGAILIYSRPTYQSLLRTDTLQKVGLKTPGPTPLPSVYKTLTLEPYQSIGATGSILYLKTTHEDASISAELVRFNLQTGKGQIVLRG